MILKPGEPELKFFFKLFQISLMLRKNKLECLPLAIFFCLIGLYQPLDGLNNPKYKLCFIQPTNFFCKEKKALAFNRDRCCHVALCLRLILFYYIAISLTQSKSYLQLRVYVQQCFYLSNGRVSAVNRTLDGSTYPG